MFTGFEMHRPNDYKLNRTNKTWHLFDSNLMTILDAYDGTSMYYYLHTLRHYDDNFRLVLNEIKFLLLHWNHLKTLKPDHAIGLLYNSHYLSQVDATALLTSMTFGLAIMVRGPVRADVSSLQCSIHLFPLLLIVLVNLYHCYP